MESPSVLDGPSYLLWETASRSIDRARRRRLRPQVPPNSDDLVPIALDDGAGLQAPPGDEEAPNLPAGALPLHPPAGSFESSSGCDDCMGYGKRAPGGLTPKRQGGKPDAPPPQRPRADSHHAQDVGDRDFVARQQFPASATSVSVTDRDLQHALPFSAAGWPPYGALRLVGNPFRSVGRLIIAVNFRGLPPTRPSVRAGREDPTTATPTVGDATVSSPIDFRTVGAYGKPETPLITKDYEVWASNDRPIQVGGKHDWRMCARLGPRYRVVLTHPRLRPRPSRPIPTRRICPRKWIGAPRRLDMINRFSPLPVILYLGEGIIAKDLVGRPPPPEGCVG